MPDLLMFPISANLLEARHVQAIGASPLVVYLWFVARTTRDEPNGDSFLGVVLHGAPVGIEQIAGELGIGYRVCRKYVAHLVKAGYVIQKRTATGMCTYLVTNSVRWAWKRKAEATDTKTASGSEEPQTPHMPVAGEPQTQIVSQGREPQTRFSHPQTQNVAVLIRKQSSHIPQKAETAPTPSSLGSEGPGSTPALESQLPLSAESTDYSLPPTEKVFDLFGQHSGHTKMLLDDKRRRMFEKRWAEQYQLYRKQHLDPQAARKAAKVDVYAVLTEFLNDQWHQENNQVRWELMFRSRADFEKWLPREENTRAKRARA